MLTVTKKFHTSNLKEFSTSCSEGCLDSYKYSKKESKNFITITSSDIEKTIIPQVSKYFLRFIVMGQLQVSLLHSPSKVDRVNSKKIKDIPASIDTMIQYPQNTYLQYQPINLSNLNKKSKF